VYDAGYGQTFLSYTVTLLLDVPSPGSRVLPLDLVVGGPLVTTTPPPQFCPLLVVAHHYCYRAGVAFYPFPNFTKHRVTGLLTTFPRFHAPRAGSTGLSYTRLTTNSAILAGHPGPATIPDGAPTGRHTPARRRPTYHDYPHGCALGVRHGRFKRSGSPCAVKTLFCLDTATPPPHPRQHDIFYHTTTAQHRIPVWLDLPALDRWAVGADMVDSSATPTGPPVLDVPRMVPLLLPCRGVAVTYLPPRTRRCDTPPLCWRWAVPVEPNTPYHLDGWLPLDGPILDGWVGLSSHTAGTPAFTRPDCATTPHTCGVYPGGRTHTGHTPLTCGGRFRHYHHLPNRTGSGTDVNVPGLTRFTTLRPTTWTLPHLPTCVWTCRHTGIGCRAVYSYLQFAVLTYASSSFPTSVLDVVGSTSARTPATTLPFPDLPLDAATLADARTPQHRPSYPRLRFTHHFLSVTLVWNHLPLHCVYPAPTSTPAAWFTVTTTCGLWWIPARRCYTRLRFTTGYRTFV